MKDNKIFSFDIDGTLCENTFGNYQKAIPIKDRIEIVNELYESGNTINLFTARGTTTGINWTEVTKNQLKDWGVKYHSLKLGKPEADIYIDDKALNADYFFNKYKSDYIQEHIDSVQKTFSKEYREKISMISSQISKSLRSSGKIILAGNGGSFSDCLHLSAEFTGRFIKDREPYSSIVLGSNISSFTSISNDYSFSECFSRELEALGREEDVYIAFSTSGSSENILKSLKVAKDKNIFSILLTSEKYNDSNSEIDLILKVCSSITSIIQELHIMTAHLICKDVEKKMGI